jgi:hypothetical protein
MLHHQLEELLPPQQQLQRPLLQQVRTWDNKSLLTLT